ncbi:MAG: MarC family protein [Thermoproteota archaeon]|jgi:Multiple antibiotic transporter
MAILDTSIQLFFLLNPLASIPILFLAYQRGYNVRSIAIRATIIAFIIAFSFVFIGQLLFGIFGISLNSFRVAGGIVIIILGIDMTMMRSESISSATEAKALISVLATPILTGPATLSYLTIKVAEIGIIQTLTSLIIAFVAVAIVLLALVWLIPIIKLEYIEFVSRLFGLFIIAFGVELFVEGAKGLVGI